MKKNELIGGLGESEELRLVPISRPQEEEKGLVLAKSGGKIRLRRIDPNATGTASKRKAEKQIDKLRVRLTELQQALYAEHQRSLLIVIQAMDTGGKDGAIKNICSGLDPNGVQLTNFKVPSSEEWDHDFLWRVHKAAPGKGIIGIWNRSHYEDVLVPRVHRQISRTVWRDRCEHINAFERLLNCNGVTFLKFFLHISKEEQKARLEARLKDPQKLWKFHPGDLKERARWDVYQRIYEAVMNETATDFAPWHIVPANRKWSRNLVLLETVVAKLEEMNPRYPKLAFDANAIVIE